MKRIWLMMRLTMKDSRRTKVWLPLVLLTFLADLVLLMSFGIRMNPAGAVSNVVSSYFYFWTWGVLFSAICLGVTTMPSERRSAVLFTLPIARWEILLGKILGNQVVAGGFLVAGYLVSLWLAQTLDLESFAYSRLGLATAFVLSFVFLCISVPLGSWLSPVVSGTLAVVVLILVPGIRQLTDLGFIASAWIAWPARILGYAFPIAVNGEPVRFAFFDRVSLWSDYAHLGLTAAIATLFFVLFAILLNRTELSTKS